MDIVDQLRQELPKRQRAALVALQITMSDHERSAGRLAAASALEAARIYDGELAFHYNTNEGMFVATCAGISIPVASEYNPSQVLVVTETVRKYRQAFFAAFDVNISGRDGGPKPLILKGPSGTGKNLLGRDLCSKLGIVPLILHGADIVGGDTFCSRAIAAAKSSSGGGLALIIVEDAQMASRPSIHDVISWCREKKVALCITLASDAKFNYCVEGCVGSRHVQFELPALNYVDILVPLLSAEGFHGAEPLTKSLVTFIIRLESHCAKELHYDFCLPKLKCVCRRAGEEARKPFWLKLLKCRVSGFA